MPKKTIDPHAPPQNPNHLLDALLVALNLKNDAALARKIGVAPPVLSKLRHYTLALTPAILLKLHDATAMSIAQLRALLHAPLSEEQLRHRKDRTGA